MKIYLDPFEPESWLVLGSAPEATAELRFVRPSPDGEPWPPVKRAWRQQDRARMANALGLPWRPCERPPGPALLATLRRYPQWPVAKALLGAAYGAGATLQTAADVARALAEAGLPPEWAEPGGDHDLAAAQTEAEAAGIWRAPATDSGAVGLEALLRLPAQPSAASVELWFDYSSPFGSLAVLAAPPGAQLRPFLLGALFRAVGGVDVPLAVASPARQRHLMRQLETQSEALGLKLHFPSRFPLRTVLSLRWTLAALALDPQAGRALAEGWVRHCWERDGDPEDVPALAALATEVGLSPPVVASWVEAQGRPALQEATRAATEFGLFGAPSWRLVSGDSAELHWGLDRLPWVRAHLRS